MRVYIDIDAQKLITAPGIQQEITALNFKRGATATVELQFTRGSTVIELPSDATGILGVKQTNHYDDNYLAAALAWVKTGLMDNTVYTFSLSFINAALDALFMVDNNFTNDVVSITLMGEIQWSTGGMIYKSPTISFIIANDINRGGETVPVAGAFISMPLYLRDINTIADLLLFPIASYASRTLLEFSIDDVGGEIVRLLKYPWPGPGVPGTQLANGVIAPPDYDPDTNNYILKQVGGPALA